MAMFQDNIIPSVEMGSNNENCPLSKRRRFAPNSMPIIECINNSDIVDHTFNSPLLLQLCEQSPSQQEIEAQLLQVGMRIRKSVNDGYKTSPGRHAFTPRPFFNFHRLSPETQAALSNATSNEEQFSAGGLHNVGNMAMQPISTATFCGINLAALAHISDDWSTPIEQQQLWTYATSHKRSMEDDSDSDDSQEFMPQTPKLGMVDAGVAMPVDYFNIDPETMSNVSPMTQVNEARRAHMTGRRLAKPRSRVRNAEPAAHQSRQATEWNPFANMVAQQQQHAQALTGHRRITSCGIEANMAFNDFGDAPFLQRREDIDMDCS